MQLSIIIPAYNESKRIGSSIRQIKAYQRATGQDIELIVSDDGSTDDTASVVAQAVGDWKVGVLRSAGNRGKGHAVRQGVLASHGDIVLFCDADLSTPIEEADKMMRVLENGADIAFGSRALPDSDVQVHQNILRETMGKAFNVLARFAAFRDIHDSQCGFKCFKGDAARKLFAKAKLDGFCFDAEIAFLAQRAGYRIQEVPVIWRNSPQSKVHILADPLKMFLDLLRIRWLHRNDTKGL